MKASPDPYFAALEAGGTKFVCAIGTSGGEILRQARFPTTNPEETIGRTARFFLDFPHPIAAIGIGSFGPIDLDPESATYGHITATPKPGWSWTDVAGLLEGALGGIPVGFDTDVNAAALGEYTWGAGRGHRSLLYLTIGTGIGGGFLADGRPLHGLVHPEMGHILLRNRHEPRFQGNCPFHQDCFEGLASGPALAARWGAPAESLPQDHPAWEIEADVIAEALAAFVCTLSPTRIILGGGVMNQEHLFPMIRQRLLALLNGYVQSPSLLERIDDYVVPPGLGGQSGVLGALAMAIKLAESRIIE